MKILGQSNGRRCMGTGSLLLAALAVACAESGDDDGSQTHFSESDDDQGATPPPTGSAPGELDDDRGAGDDGAGGRASDDASDDDVQDDDASDDDTAPATDDDGNADPEPSAGPDDGADDDRAVDTDTPAPADDDGQTGVEPEPCSDAECADDDPETYEPCAGKQCGERCTVCAPSDPNCAEDPVVMTCSASGQCELGEAECTVRPLCAPTEFESTDDDCVEESWVWDGGQCTSVTHCSCASGDCDRVYPDVESC